MENVQIASNSRVFGSIMLISGSCIGAGMLGLPVLSAAAGFQPTVMMFIFCWFFVTCAALLLVEVNLWFTGEVNLLTMTEKTLGKFGKGLAWLLFLFLFYSLTLAYVAGGGALFLSFVHSWFGITLPQVLGPIFIASIFGVAVYLGTTTVDWINRVLMVGLAITYALLVGLGSLHVNISNLALQNWTSSLFLMPIMFISFGFHNLIPSLKTYLHSNPQQLRLSIVIGSAIPLIIYLLWIWVILGLVPSHVAIVMTTHDSDGMATEMLSQAIGASWVVDASQLFAFFAIVTSLIGVTLSLLDFLADGLKIEKDRNGRIILTLLSIVPPLIFAFIYPNLFLAALSMAGGFGAAVLFGIIPVLMVWVGRYRQNRTGVHLLPGGKVTLVMVFLFGALVLGIEIVRDFFV